MKRKLQKIGYFCLISSMIVFIGFFVIMFVHRRDIVRRNSFDNLQQKAEKVILCIGDGMGENILKLGKNT